MSAPTPSIRSRIWHEVAEEDNPFAAAACSCHGYDVYGELIHKAHWAEYLFLLFAGEAPSAAQARLMEALAVAIAHPGIRDHSVRAAMNAGVGGSTAAAALMAALAVGAGQLGGAHEVAIAMGHWRDCGRDIEAWRTCLSDPPQDEGADIWLPMEHPAGFDPHGASCATPVRQTLERLAECSSGDALTWLRSHRTELEGAADCPLAMSGVAAAAFIDLGLEARQGEMLYLMLRLPGAAVHALEQQDYGWRNYPFFADAVKLMDDPGPSAHNRDIGTKT